MKRIYTILTLLFLCSAQLSFAQNDSSFRLVNTYIGDIADAALDNFGNLYVISSQGQIKKFTPTGDSAGVYNQVKKYGNLYSIDVSNPLKLILFYKEFSTVVVLDRFFAPLATLDLRKYSVLQPTAVGLSYDNNIWVFDEYDNKLKKIDEYGHQLLETPDFRTIFDQSTAPQKIINENGLVYLADSANGVFVFDNYGSYKKTIPMKSWQSITVNNHYVISTNNEIVTIYDTNSLMQMQRKTPYFKPYLHSFTHGDKLIIFSNDQLQVYQYRY